MKKFANIIQESLFDVLDSLFDIETKVVKNCSNTKRLKDIFTDTVEYDLSKNKNNNITFIETSNDIYLNYLFNRENLKNSLKDRYLDNIEALKLLDILESSGRNANEKEQHILSKYSGWGGLSKYFEDNKYEFELKRFLKNHYETTKKSTLTSFYTNLNIIKFIYKVIEKLGFEKGRILEPSLGTGRFLGALNEEVFYNSNITGIEIDTISYKIAKQLYQSVEIINKPFEDTELKDDSFDLIVSNIPFGDIPVYGKTDKDLNKYNCKIHDYYFLKSIKKLRDNGLMVFITSTYTMDKENDNIRKLIDEKCNLLGAVRLPMNTFCDTSASCDIIFLQKDIHKKAKYYNKSLDDENIDKIEEINKNSWINVISDGDKTPINEYYLKNPHMLLGENKLVKGRFREEIKLISNKKLESKDYDKLLKYFPCEVYEVPLSDEYMFEDDEILDCLDENIRESEFVIIGKELYQRQGQKLIPKKYYGVRLDKFKLYVDIKEKLNNLIEKELNNCNDNVLKELQDELNISYEKFYNKYGFINNKANKKVLKEDVLYYYVSCLENFDSEKEIYYKSEIFTKRTICLSSKVEEPKNIDDAILISFNNKGDVNIPYIASLLNVNEDTLREEMLDKRYIYHNPISNRYEYKNEYLSGNVKGKLKFMEENFINDKRYKSNIEDLRINQPEYVYDVYFDICSTWIPINVKIDFIRDTLGLPDRFKLTYSHSIGYKKVGDFYVEPALNYVEWGTSRRDALDVVIATLNISSITVYDYSVDPTGKEVRTKNAKETQLVLEKQEKWKLAFVDYIMNNDKLYKELIDLYNETCVLFKERNYENILYDLRINPSIKLMDHQLKAASRIITSNNNTLLCHSVGTGKTYTSICAMHEWSRIGLYRDKNESDYFEDGKKKIGNGNIMFVVPNSLAISGQFAREYLKLYPYANILSTTPQDFTKSNRRRMLSKMVMNKYDAIIIPHSVLGLIPIKPENELSLMQEEEQEYLELINYYSKEGDRITVKELQNKLEVLRVKMTRLMDIHRDNGLVYWEDLNVDRLVIDESQYFKNCTINTKMRINGVNIKPSKRAKDLHNKIKLHNKIYGEKGIVFLSATPISNSVSELYIINEFLGKEILKDAGIFCFDDWASRFGEVVSAMEIDVTGQSYRMAQRFCKFKNVPELIVMFRLISDIVFTEDVMDIKLPKLKNDKSTIIKIEPTLEMAEYIETLVERAEAIWKGGVKPKDDNMLMVVNEGRMLAVSPYLIGIRGDSPKINALCDNVYKLYNENRDHSQIIFCDMGTPGGITYCVYDEIKEKLISKGIDEKEIAYIHDGSTEIKRKQLVDKFNNGSIKILIGSTEKMGVGMNLQKNLKFAHHVNCPWKSSEIEQRDGRILRQGNENEEVEIFRYILSKSFDAYSWACVERKARFIKQVISNKTTAREIEDVDNSIMSYAETKACACGDERILKLCTLNNEIQKLQLLEKGFKEQKIRVANTIEYKQNQIKENSLLIDKVLNDKYIFDNSPKTLKLNGFNYASGKELLEVLQTILNEKREGIIGEINGLKIKLEITLELGSKVYKAYVGNCIKFSTKKSAKNVIQNLINIEQNLNNKLETLKKINNNLLKEIEGLEKSKSNEFKDKDKLNKYIIEKKNLENELYINKEKIQ